jgi:uncharacterized protein
MFIDINTLGSEGLTFDRSVRLCGLEGPSREKLPVVDARLEGHVTPAPGGADLEARIMATLPLTCSRCLETFPWDVRADFRSRIVKVADPADAPRDSDDGDEDSVVVAPEGKIGLEDLAIEQLYLNLPLKPICSPGCKGLCPTCGANRNLAGCGCAVQASDPRLAALLPFRKKLQGS